MDECLEVLDEALCESNYAEHARKLLKVKSLPKNLSVPEAAYLLMGKRNMSQRAYKNVKKILKKSDIHIPKYPELKDYCKNLYVGDIYKLHDDTDSCNCMGYGCTVTCTLTMIFKTIYFYGQLSFLSKEKQKPLFSFLKEKDSELYSNLDGSKRTIIIRDTGDNFRAAGRFPTEQTSFSLMNLPKFVNSPYGQHISTLWRGSESRETLKMHVDKHYKELNSLVKHGMTLKSPFGTEESFNVIAIFVADLSFVKEVLGRCQCTHTYGCFHCQLPIKQWLSVKPKTGTDQSISKMSTLGEKALDVLGECPDKTSPKYKKFTMENYGQWVSVNFHTLFFLPRAENALLYF